MDPKAIVDQKIIRQIFSDNLSWFPGVSRLSQLTINQHNPQFVLDRTAVLAEYKLKVETSSGETHQYVLRGSSDPSEKRQKHFFILQALRKNGFDSGKNIVPRALGYFPEHHLLVYENAAGQSLYDKFRWTESEIWKQKIDESIDWLIDFHNKKPFIIPETEFDWQEERRKFEQLTGRLNQRFPSHAEMLTRATAKIMAEEREILNAKSFCLVHGDFQPQNIIFSDHPPQTVVIDFNDSMTYDELYDLGYFVTQTKTMVQNIHQVDITDFLESRTKHYLKQRGLDTDPLASKKLSLFKFKTLLHIKSVTTEILAKNILKEIENYVS